MLSSTLKHCHRLMIGLFLDHIDERSRRYQLIDFLPSSRIGLLMSCATTVEP